MSQLPMPMTPRQALDVMIIPALKELGPTYDSPRARVMLLATAGQESGLKSDRGKTAF